MPNSTTMNIARTLILLTVIVCLTACKKSSDDSNILINIENEFEVSLLELLSPGDNQLSLQISTIDLLECTNYVILHSHTISDKLISASIDLIKDPEVCDPGTAYATSNIPLNTFENGEYEFQVNLEQNTIVNEGTLTINDLGYFASLETQHGIKFSPQSLLKLPDGYIWGQINRADDVEDETIDAFLEELRLLTEASNLEAGNYGHFKIESDGDIDLGEEELVLPFESANDESFIFSYSGDKEAINNLLEQYRNDYTSRLHIQLLTSEGEEL